MLCVTSMYSRDLTQTIFFQFCTWMWVIWAFALLVEYSLKTHCILVKMWEIFLRWKKKQDLSFLLGETTYWQSCEVSLSLLASERVSRSSWHDSIATPIWSVSQSFPLTANTKGSESGLLPIPPMPVHMHKQSLGSWWQETEQDALSFFTAGNGTSASLGYSWQWN